MRTRRGFSLIELLAVLTIVGLLVAIIAPAIGAAREAARRSQCQSHLRQIGLAIHGYESSYGMLPNGLRWRRSLLPYLEQHAVYDLDGLPGVTGDLPIAHTKIATYLCPSDPAPDEYPGTNQFPDPQGAANYVGCYGSGALCCGVNGVFNIWNGANRRFFPMQPVRLADIGDGLSNTAAVSEFLHADGTNELPRLRTRWTTPRAYLPPNELDALANLCESLPANPVDFGWTGANVRGVPWTDPNFGGAMYNHALPPNRPSCNNGGTLLEGVHTASSYHGAGVNLLYADGHVSFESASIARQVWRKLGSRVDRVVGPDFP